MKLVKYYKSGFIYKKWRWTVTASNGEIIGSSSQGFSSKQMAQNNYRLLGIAIGNEVNGDVNEDIHCLIDECISKALSCSVTYQHINDYSIEIYSGYGKKYKKYYYSDGHLEMEDAFAGAMEFLNKHEG